MHSVVKRDFPMVVRKEFATAGLLVDWMVGLMVVMWAVSMVEM